MSEKLTFDQFMTECHKSYPMRKYTVRWGQHCFNQLTVADKHDLAAQIAGVDGLDPYYNDIHMDNFWRFISAHWEE